MSKQVRFDFDEFKQYLKINRMQLDTEIEQHPTLLFEVSEAYAKAVAVRDTSKEELKGLSAELYAKHRKMLARSEEKVTEGMVNAAVQQDDKYLEAQTALIEADESVGKLSALKDAFHSRGYMLRDLASLYLANYFTRDSANSTMDTTDARHKKQVERINEKRKDRARL